MHEFKHPKYYKELRKRNKSDQAISNAEATAASERAPGQGLKPQATSRKPQAPSDKHHAPSHKHQAPGSVNHEKVSRPLNRGAQCR